MSQDGEKLQKVVCNIKVLDPYHQASDFLFLSQLVVLPHLLFACSLNEFVCKKNKVHALLLFIFKLKKKYRLTKVISIQGKCRKFKRLEKWPYLHYTDRHVWLNHFNYFSFFIAWKFVYKRTEIFVGEGKQLKKSTIIDHHEHK